MLKKNLCVSNLVGKTKQEYFFDHRKITDNKAFWKNMPFSTNKGKHQEHYSSTKWKNFIEEAN